MLGVAALAVAVLAVAFEMWFATRYHELAFWNPPPRLHWCGRDYDRSPSGPVGLTDLAGYRTVLRIPPLFTPVLADTPRRPDTPGGACSMSLVYRPLSRHETWYSISGGP